MVAGECVGCYYARMKGATTSLLGNSCQQVTTDAVTGDCEGNACSSNPSVPLVLGNACLSASVADVSNEPVAADGVTSDAYHAQVKSFYLRCMHKPFADSIACIFVQARCLHLTCIYNTSPVS